MSFWVTTKRVARYGLIGFIRNGFVSLSAIVIMVLTLFVIALFLIFGAALDSTLKLLSEKVDINVYFTPTATEEQVMNIKSALETLPEVQHVSYTNRDQALAEFRERHKNEASTIQALDQLSENPLGASLSIRAKETSQYASIASFLDAQQRTTAESGITKVNYFQNQQAIERLASFIETSRTVAIAVAVFLAGASIMIAFNTIRLTIYTARDEIGVMNLVGASRWYVRGPFMIAGILYGVIATLIVLLILYPLTAWMGPASETFFVTFNVFDYFINSFTYLFFSLMGAGILLGALSSYLAIRRYLHS